MMFCHKRPVQPVELEVNSVIAGLEDMLLYVVEDDIELRINSDEAEDSVVFTDPQQIENAIINLVANAIKFTERGEVVVDVKGSSLSDDQMHLHFSVRDTGIGIPAEKCKSIFDEFNQAVPGGQ